jgi:hypothetical protein
MALWHLISIADTVSRAEFEGLHRVNKVRLERNGYKFAVFASRLDTGVSDSGLEDMERWNTSNVTPGGNIWW